MKSILTLSALLLLITGNALAGSQYDACIKKDKALRAKEASDCSGLRYLLDPSSCYKTQRERKEHDGTCAAIGAAEQAEPAPPKTAAESTPANAPQKAAPPAPPAAAPERNTGNATPVAPQKSSIAQPQQQTAVAAEQPVDMTCDQLREENARLKSEISRLRSEYAQFRKAVSH